MPYLTNGHSFRWLSEQEAQAYQLQMGESFSSAEPVVTPSPPTKDQQIAHILATIGKGRDRSLIQTIITLAETVAIPKLAADNNVSFEVAKAAAYARNATYKTAVDCEAACRAIEVAP